jgi:fructose-1,6-bisphosphatase I/sedoheptulose-1,7-bisphosphatase
MLTDRTTLTEFLILERRKHPDASGDLNALILDIALACKAIAARVAQGALGGVLGNAEKVNVQGEQQKKLDVLANEVFLRANQFGGYLAGMVSEEIEDVIPIPEGHPRGKYLLAFDPLDGSSNIDVNSAVGSIFSILRAPRPGEPATLADFLQRGAEQVCSGYVIYGPATMLVITVGTGVHGFTLEPQLGEFFLTHPDIRIPRATREFAINASNVRFWEPAVKRYVDECLAGKVGPRGADFNMRWIAAVVAEAHRILMRGGVFLYPRDSKESSRHGRLRLLYEASPLAFLIEQAGGAASSGYQRILDIQPTDLHQRIGLVFGSSEEVERISRYHQDHNERPYAAPLFGERGLFRGAS